MGFFLEGKKTSCRQPASPTTHRCCLYIAWQFLVYSGTRPADRTPSPGYVGMSSQIRGSGKIPRTFGGEFSANGVRIGVLVHFCYSAAAGGCRVPGCNSTVEKQKKKCEKAEAMQSWCPGAKQSQEQEGSNEKRKGRNLKQKLKDKRLTAKEQEAKLTLLTHFHVQFLFQYTCAPAFCSHGYIRPYINL